MSADQFAAEGRYVYLPLAMALIFGLALLLAVIWRRAAPVHGRFMAATALPSLDPLFARLLYFYAPPLPAEELYQVPAFGLTIAVLAAMIVSMPTGAAGRRSLLYFSGAAAAVLFGFFFVPNTEPWMLFAAWFRVQPIT